MEKYYYELKFTQRAPLRISAGFGTDTDNDLIKDRRGFPFLPGTGIAGVLRCEFDEETAKELFGIIEETEEQGKKEKKVEIRESRVLVSDAVLPDDAEFRVSRRDGVGLNEQKTAIKGAKYDFETAEADKPYRGVIELTNEGDADALREVLSRCVARGVCLGARTTRGYGSMKVEVREHKFTLPDELDDWLKFDPFDEHAFAEDEPLKPSDAAEDKLLVVRAALQIDGSFSVRTNTSALATEGDLRVTPDTVPMENREGRPVIPGTSWAGAFRHHMRALADELGLGEAAQAEIDLLFGKIEGAKRRSAIRFSETAIENSKRMTVTRTAIERFTAAPRHRALFTSQVAVDGEGELVVTLPKDASERVKGLLGVSLCDLNLGLLGFGGENGVGRGGAVVTRLTVNGADKTAALRAGDVAALWKEEAK